MLAPALASGIEEEAFGIVARFDTQIDFSESCRRMQTLVEPEGSWVVRHAEPQPFDLRSDARVTQRQAALDASLHGRRLRELRAPPRGPEEVSEAALYAAAGSVLAGRWDTSSAAEEGRLAVWAALGGPATGGWARTGAQGGRERAGLIAKVHGDGRVQLH
jgi:hypothetical protein